ncbi:MAG TPA: CRTAC1 family protein [Vicinamibacterales bacterium]|nr:CRTAC1 family protein [Vicinamibacterales bacterium]
MPRRLLLAILACLSLPGCSGDSSAPRPSEPAASRAWFDEYAAEAGIDFVHFNGMSGQLFYPEIMGPGVGLLDYDNDGDLDLYLVQGQMLGRGKSVKDATFPPKGALRDRFFRNDLTVGPDGERRLRFTDVTAEAGIDIATYGMGVAAADIDNDGFVDIYRTGLTESVMLRNNGNGTFSDVTAKTGTSNKGGWGVSAAFVDIDRDGWLDLYVGNYLVYSVDGDIDCIGLTGQPDYCPPTSYRPQPDKLYRNRGNGTFADVSAAALESGVYGPALGVSTADFNNDGWLDIYVGNDGMANQLWMNQKNGTFKDMAFLNGAAVNGQGNAEASMGIDAGDFDNDGDEDLFVTNWLAQMNILYQNTGNGVFEDRKAASGLGAPSLAKTGFGTAWFDYDNDSWLDLITLNGSVSTIEAQARANDPFPLKMLNQLYRNLGNGRFEDVSAQGGEPFTLLDVSKGAAVGDIDNDGDVDVAVGTTSGPTRLFLNNVGNRSHWLGLRLTGVGGRDMIGARVWVARGSGPELMRRARSDGSYASANDPRVLVGLGPSTGPVTVRVQWPDGTLESWANQPVDRWTTLKQGTGK